MGGTSRNRQGDSVRNIEWAKEAKGSLFRYGREAEEEILYMRLLCVNSLLKVFSNRAAH